MQASRFGDSIRDFAEDRSARPGVIAQMDPLLLFASLGLIFCSLYTIAGATADDVAGNPLYYVTRQGTYAAIGIALMLLVARFDYSRLRELKLGIYAGMIGLIALVLIIGAAARGSRRWIELPFFTFQPSEFGKVLLILALSAFIVDRSRKLSAKETTSRIMLLALIPAGLVIIQPDLGTGLVYIAIVMALLFVAGTSWKHLTALAALGITAVLLTLVALPAIGVNVLQPYQVARLTSFLNPNADPSEASYQVTQSTVAIGAGQKTGRGADDATQTRLDFLPEHHTDFVFSVVGEEFGFMGAAIVLSLYALLIWRALRILTMAKNLYGALIAAGVVAMLMFQVFVNVGMTIGIMPVTGVTLPLMSYGGASVITTFLALGLLQSVHVQSRVLSEAKGREAFA
jgi:rod shape determining protein RodA